MQKKLSDDCRRKRPHKRSQGLGAETQGCFRVIATDTAPVRCNEIDFSKECKESVFNLSQLAQDGSLRAHCGLSQTWVHLSRVPRMLTPLKAKERSPCITVLRVTSQV
jgi:hypothetical protein